MIWRDKEKKLHVQWFGDDGEKKERIIQCPQCRSFNVDEYQTVARLADGFMWVCADCGKLFND